MSASFALVTASVPNLVLVTAPVAIFAALIALETICAVFTALSASFALVTASTPNLASTIAPAAITSPCIAFTAILALVTASAASFTVVIAPSTISPALTLVKLPEALPTNAECTSD